VTLLAQISAKNL